MGRNIFQAEDPVAMIQAVSKVVHELEKPGSVPDVQRSEEPGLRPEPKVNVAPRPRGRARHRIPQVVRLPGNIRRTALHVDATLYLSQIIRVEKCSSAHPCDVAHDPNWNAFRADLQERRKIATRELKGSRETGRHESQWRFRACDGARHGRFRFRVRRRELFLRIASV
ncbi:MAG: hypothetical protein R3D80_05495 [Paracoccaceae bacterium]